MVFDPLEYPEQADDKVETVHQETNPDETDQRQLVVANVVPERAFISS